MELVSKQLLEGGFVSHREMRSEAADPVPVDPFRSTGLESPAILPDALGRP